MDTIVVNSVLQKEDFGEFKAILYKAKIKLSNRQLLLLTVTVVLMLLMLIYTLFFRQTPVTGAQQPESRVTTWPIILLFVLILYRLATPMFVDRKARKEFENNKYLMKKAEYIFAQDGVRAYSDGKNLNLHWVEIYKVVETEKYIALYLSSLEMNIIPKRCFSEEEKLISVLNLLKEKLPQTKYEKLGSF